MLEPSMTSRAGGGLDLRSAIADTRVNSSLFPFNRTFGSGWHRPRRGRSRRPDQNSPKENFGLGGDVTVLGSADRDFGVGEVDLGVGNHRETIPNNRPQTPTSWGSEKPYPLCLYHPPPWCSPGPDQKEGHFSDNFSVIR